MSISFIYFYIHQLYYYNTLNALNNWLLITIITKLHQQIIFYHLIYSCILFKINTPLILRRFSHRSQSIYALHSSITAI